MLVVAASLKKGRGLFSGASDSSGAGGTTVLTGGKISDSAPTCPDISSFTCNPGETKVFTTGADGCPVPSCQPGTGSTSFPIQATVRQSTGSSYDRQYGGVYLFTDPFKTHSLHTVPFGSSITLLSQTVGVPYSLGSPDIIWYNTASGGYISEHDVIL